jgi:tetratricopeptide (TPR) repeat protein
MLVGRFFLRAALVALVAATRPVQAQLGGDLQAQILYAFQTEDLHQLSDLVQSLSGQVNAGGGDATLRYHLAHAEYRFAELAGASRAHEAEAALSDCIDQLKPGLEQDVKSVELLTLQSACYADLANLSTLQSVYLRARASERLTSAYKLAPQNPRVNLLLAMDGISRSKPESAAAKRAFVQLQLAARLFEQSSATNPDAPGWGHAEAYLALGRQLLARGDVLGARNWIEKALIVAPDFKVAQRQLRAMERP